MLIKRVEPAYPQLAKLGRVSGQVTLMVEIGANGKVEEVRVVSGHPLLLQAAMDAVKKWRYRPHQLDGQAVEFDTQVELSFVLDAAPAASQSATPKGQ